MMVKSFLLLVAPLWTGLVQAQQQCVELANRFKVTSGCTSSPPGEIFCHTQYETSIHPVTLLESFSLCEWHAFARPTPLCLGGAAFTCPSPPSAPPSSPTPSAPPSSPPATPPFNPPSSPPSAPGAETPPAEFCAKIKSGEFTDLRALDPPEWCNAGDRKTDEAKCESAYINIYNGPAAYKNFRCRFERNPDNGDTRCYLSGPGNGAPEDEIWCPHERDPYCDTLDADFIDVRKLDPPEWCNTGPVRKNSKEDCESAYATTYAGTSFAGEPWEKRHRCQYNDKDKKCVLGEPWEAYITNCIL